MQIIIFLIFSLVTINISGFFLFFAIKTIEEVSCKFYAELKICELCMKINLYRNKIIFAHGGVWSWKRLQKLPILTLKILYQYHGISPNCFKMKYTTVTIKERKGNIKQFLQRCKCQTHQYRGTSRNEGLRIALEIKLKSFHGND